MKNQVRNYFFEGEGLINPTSQVFTSVHWCSQDSSYVRWREFWCAISENRAVPLLKKDWQATPKKGDCFPLVLTWVEGKGAAKLPDLSLRWWVPPTQSLHGKRHEGQTLSPAFLFGTPELLLNRNFYSIGTFFPQVTACYLSALVCEIRAKKV